MAGHGYATPAYCWPVLPCSARSSWREAMGAVAVWLQSQRLNHCFLILPIALYMMWTRRGGLASLPHGLPRRRAFLVLPLSFIWLLMANRFGSRGAAIRRYCDLAGGAVRDVGLARLSALCRSLSLSFPSCSKWRGACAGAPTDDGAFRRDRAQAHRVPVYSNGAVIEIPAGTFAVAEACAGLRFLVATVAFGLFYAAQIYRGVLKRLIFIALCIVVPILANGLRVFGFIWAAQLLGSPTAAVADHLIYGWAFFFPCPDPPGVRRPRVCRPGHAGARRRCHDHGEEKLSPARVLTAGALATVAPPLCFPPSGFCLETVRRRRSPPHSRPYRRPGSARQMTAGGLRFWWARRERLPRPIPSGTARSTAILRSIRYGGAPTISCDPTIAWPTRRTGS